MASILLSTYRVAPGRILTLTVWGIGTTWKASAPVFKGTGLTFGPSSVKSDTKAIVTMISDMTPQTATITETTSGACDTIVIRKPIH